MTALDRADILPAQASERLVELRGASGRLYAMFDPKAMIIEFRKGGEVERVDLGAYQLTPRPIQATAEPHGADEARRKP